MSTHPTYSTPDPELLPSPIRAVAEAADAAGQRAHDLKQRADLAARKLREAEAEWPRAVAAAAADPSGKAPTDKRPALAVEAQRADEMARAADVHARGLWEQLRRATQALDADALAELDPSITAAADEYRQAITALEAAWENMHAALRVREWLSAAVVGTPGATGTVRPRLGTYRANRPAPAVLPKVGRFYDLTMAEAVAALTADADALDALKAKEQRRADSAEREAQAKEQQRAMIESVRSAQQATQYV